MASVGENSTELDVLNDRRDEEEKEEFLQMRNGDEAFLPGCPLESSNIDQRFFCLTALEILREAITVFRINPSGFLTITAILICPIATLILSNALVDETQTKKLSFLIRLAAEASGLPDNQYVKVGCRKSSEMILSFAYCFPFYISFWLFAKAAVVASVVCSYVGKSLSFMKTLDLLRRAWTRLVATYLCACVIIFGFLTACIVLLLIVSTFLLAVGVPYSYVLYCIVGIGLMFSLPFANTVVSCNLAMSVSILESCYGVRAFFRSRHLIRGRTQVALALFLGTNIGFAFVESLYDHRVKTLSYGDGSSRIWEGPLLVIMYSFIVLIDTMMNCIFYFSCKSSSPEGLDSKVFLEHS